MNKKKKIKHAGGVSLTTKLVAALVLIVIAVVAVNYWASLGKTAAIATATPVPTEEPTPAPTLAPVIATATPAPTATATPTPQPKLTRIEIGDFYYRPDNVTVKVGEVVVWWNNGGAIHTVTGREGRPDGFDSKWLGAGMEFNYTFTQPGVYNYLCSVHGGMFGTVIVEN